MANEGLTPTGRVILGMIRRGRRTGYDIKQLVDVSTRFFWAASYGQIYPELKRLEKAGLIQGEPDPAGGRARTAYRLTAAGDRALGEWLASEGDMTYEMRDEGLLKLFFSEGRDPDEVLELLRRMRARHEGIVETLRALGPELEHPQPGPAMVRALGIEYHEGLIRLLREAEERVGREAAVRS